MFGPLKIQGVQERDGSRPKTRAVKRKCPHRNCDVGIHFVAKDHERGFPL